MVDDSSGVKIARLRKGITALIAVNSRCTQFIVHVVMRMPVNPKRNPAGANQRIQIRGKGGAQLLASMVGWNGAWTGRMMRHHNGPRRVMSWPFAAPAIGPTWRE